MNVANPGIALAHSGTSVVGADSDDTGSVEWCITQIGVDVPIIRQTTSYNCAPSAAIQAFYGSQIYDYSNSNNNFVTQISSLASSAGTTSAYGTDGENLVAAMNQIENKFSRFIKNKTISSEADFKAKISTSLNNGYAAIVTSNGIKLRQLTQYAGYPYDTGHYISLMGYDEASGKVILCDCNWTVAYCGIHIVDVSTLYSIFTMLICNV